jgi:hypothetical protein
MKNLVLAMVATIGLVSSAAEVLDARLSDAQDSILVDVKYGGGCKEHKFKLEVGACAESFPVQCGVEVIDLTRGDFCEALIHRTVEFNLADYNLDDRYYSGARLTLKGDGDSRVTISLPR